MDLGPAGDAAADLVAGHVTGDRAEELFDKVGTLGAGADKAHLAAQNVQELGELVEVGAAEQAAEGGAARVVVGGEGGAALEFGIEAHGADLDDVEEAAVNPHPLLAVEGGAAIVAMDQPGGEGDEGRGGDEPDERKREIDQALERGVPSLERGLAQAKERDAVEGFDRHAAQEELEGVGDDAELGELAFAGEEDRGDGVAVDERLGEDHLVDAVEVKYRLDLVETAEDGEGGDGVGGGGTGDADENADGEHAALGVAEEASDDFFRQRAGADDEDARLADAAPDEAPLEEAVEQDAPGEERDDDDAEHNDGEDAGEIGAVGAAVIIDRDEDHEGEAGAGDDPARDAGIEDARAAAVEVLEAEREEPDRPGVGEDGEILVGVVAVADGDERGQRRVKADPVSKEECETDGDGIVGNDE